jgi:pantothenate kinase-related protein Tda10
MLTVSIQVVNQFMRSYEPLNMIPDLWITFQADNIDDVYLWRLQAEEELFKIKGSAMSKEEVFYSIIT